MKQLEAVSIVAPGFFGLNTQESGVTLSPNYAKELDNVVIDKFGRLGARKGWVMKTTDGVSPDGSDQLDDNPIRFMIENVNANNTTTLISAGNNKVFSGGNDSLLTDLTPSFYTISGDDWSGASLLETTVLVQEGQEPLVYSPTATPLVQPMVYYTSDADGTVADFASLPGSPTVNDRYLTLDTNIVYEWDGTDWNDVTVYQNYGTAYPKQIIAAYGRFWSHNGSTIYWSTDIADSKFPCFCGGTSGSLNIASILPRNVDEIIALAVHNDFLVIFCKNNIVLYSGASNPIGVNFALADIIAGVGCVAKNSVQPTGNDLIFLSDTGVRSLGRLVSEKSLPMRDLTKNIRDDLVKTLALEIGNGSVENICSVYSEQNAFYLLSFPAAQTVYVLDMRSPLQDGSARCTTWAQYEARSFLRLADRTLLIGKTNGIGEYFGYTDNGGKYSMSYFSHYLDLGSNITNKMLKQIKVSVFGGSGQIFTVKVGTNYQDNYTPYSFTINTGDTYEFGVAEYGFDGESGTVGLSEYAGGVLIDTLKSSIIGSGNVIQIGFEAEVNGSELSVQALDCFVKTGRIS
jgi:hypothetical protein